MAKISFFVRKFQPQLKLQWLKRLIETAICTKFKTKLKSSFGLDFKHSLIFLINPFAPEPPATACADPGPSYPL